ncbi:MAG: hypothetical protein AAB835_02675 [Patescibacteria group bacterium]
MRKSAKNILSKNNNNWYIKLEDFNVPNYIQYFDRLFIYDSYSCRNFKGTHKALNRFRDFGRKVSKNNTKTCLVLKRDIRKCFASIDHKILRNILSDYIWELVPKIADFLEEELKLALHPDKLFVKTLSSGVDFLGWVHFPNHRVLRAATKRKMFRNIETKTEDKKENTTASYLGMLGWGKGYKLQNQIEQITPHVQVSKAAFDI